MEGRLFLKRKLAAVVLVVALAGCHGYQVHPGAVNTFDSKTYDSLLVAQSVIDTSRAQFASGALPAKFKPAANKAIVAYDEAMPAYKAWHIAMEKGEATDSQLAKLKTLVAALNAAITAFREAR